MAKADLHAAHQKWDLCLQFILATKDSMCICNSVNMYASVCRQIKNSEINCGRVLRNLQVLINIVWMSSDATRYITTLALKCVVGGLLVNCC